MANTIRDTGGLKYVEMQNARFARLPLASLFDSNAWTTVRVALRMDVVSTTTFTPTSFFFGLCSGTTNIPGDATPTNAIGARSTPGVAFSYYSAGGPTGYQFTGEMKPYKNVGGVETAGVTFGSGAVAFNSSSNTNADGPACGMFVTITKGSPNYTLDLFCVNAASSAGLTQAQFEAQSIATTPVKTGQNYITGKTIAFDQTAGTLDAAFVYWSEATALRLFDWRVVRIA